MSKKRLELSKEQWDKVETLYISALDVDRDKRSAFLEAECNDKAIRADVMSLLSAYDSSQEFLERPLFTEGLQILDSKYDLAGETIDRYELLKQLGRGGMGDVYLAYDPRLDRHIALKLLPPQITDDQEHVQRFEREARLASSISHPNVAHIYEMGDAHGKRYITMEYVAGKTLRQLLNEGSLDTDRVIEIGLQTLEGLKAAHKSGVIHRDIKPENIMLRDDGYVKILDFGIAKIVVEGPAAVSRRSLESFQTDPAMMMGTALYMSPELIRRNKVDHRTDLWSLAVLLYEALTGKRPFEGELFSQVLAAILETELTELGNTELSLPLQSFLRKSLDKNPEYRYQSAEEMADALLLARQPSAQISKPAPKADQKSTKQIPTTQIGRPITIPTRLDTYKSDRAETPPRQRSFRWAVPVAVSVLVVACLAISYRIFMAIKAARPAEPSFNLQFERLNLLAGEPTRVVLSPDGQFVASVVVEGGKQSIHIMELATSSDLQIVPPSASGYCALSFSTDGNYLYFLENQGEVGNLYRVSKLGGAQRRIASEISTAVSFSPDGNQITYIRPNHTDEMAELVIAQPDGSLEHLLSKNDRSAPDRFSRDPFGPGPAWSKDGKSIACPTLNLSVNPRQMNIDLVDVETGARRRLNTTPLHEISGLAWTNNGKALVLSAKTAPADPWQLHWLSYPEGMIRKITNDPNNYTSLSASNESAKLLGLSTEENSTIWLIPVKNPDAISPLSVRQRTGVSFVESTAGMGFVYAVVDGRRINLWTQTSTGEARQLTFEESENYRPTVTRDGRYVVFVSTRTGSSSQPGTKNVSSIWRINADGTDQKQLTFGPYQDMPSLSPDGKWVVFRTTQTINKVSIDGGSETVLIKASAYSPVVSPDGSKLAFLTNEKPDSEVYLLKVCDFSTLKVIKQIAMPKTINEFVGIRWNPDGAGLSYVAKVDGAANVWSQPLSGGGPRQITRFKDGEIKSFAWSNSNDQIVAVRNIRTTVSVLVKLF